MKETKILSVMLAALLLASTCALSAETGIPVKTEEKVYANDLLGFNISPKSGWEGEYQLPESSNSKLYNLAPANAIFEESKASPFWVLSEYYDMSPSEKRLYGKIAEGVGNFDLKIEVDSIPQNDAERKNLSKICNIVYFTQPEVFYWDFNVRYALNGKPSEDGKYYLLPIYIVDGKTLHADMQGANNTLLYPPVEEIAAAKAWVKRGICDIHEKLKSLPIQDGMTMFEKELAVHDWLCDILTYDGSDIFKHEFNTIHGALVDGKVDCSGYSRTFQYIMCMLGVESIVFEGYAGQTPHAWNAVKLDGDWYQSDVNVDGVMFIKDSLPWHCYLNRTDKYMTENGYTKGIADSRYINPDITCTATKYNYFVITDSYIASDSDFINKLSARIALARANGEKAFEIEFDPNYGKPSEIYDKLALIDQALLINIRFLYSSRGIVFALLD